MTYNKIIEVDKLENIRKILGKLKTCKIDSCYIESYIIKDLLY